MARKKKKLAPEEEVTPVESTEVLEETALSEDAVAEEISAEESTQVPEEEPLEVDPYAPYRYIWEEGQPRPRHPMTWKQKTLLSVCVVLAVGVVTLCVLAFLHFTKPAAEENTPTPPTSSEVVLTPVAPKNPEDALSVQEMIESVKPSVVGIDVVKNDNTTGVASGLIVHKDGYIVTNRHVVADARTITVHLANGENFPGSVIGSDELSDIAVVRIRNAGELTAAALGDSSRIRQGDWVVAIGTPGGLEFSASATLGIVSGTERRVQMQSENSNVSKTYTVIQTDASINPGNSGGPLVNVYGQVIGINSLKLSTDSYESIGFALPINGVISVANQIIATGRVEERPEEDYVVGGTVFGATFEYFSALSASESGLKSGAYVKLLDQDGPAEKAGVKMGDIITVFDGKDVTSLSVITEILSQKKAGDVVEIKVWRERAETTLSVTLSAYQGV